MIVLGLARLFEIEPFFAERWTKIVEPRGILVELGEEWLSHPGWITGLNKVADQQRPVRSTQ